MKCMKDFPIAPMKICDLVKDGANLNLLQAKENRKEKSDMMLDAYIKQLKKRNIDCNSVIKCLPPLDDRLTDYKLNHFLVFYKKRRKIMIEAIKKIFE